MATLLRFLVPPSFSDVRPYPNNQSNGAVFVPLQDDLNQKASLHGMSAITEDGIHLTRQGHRILAEKLYTLITAER